MTHVPYVIKLCQENILGSYNFLSGTILASRFFLRLEPVALRDKFPAIATCMLEVISEDEAHISLGTADEQY